MHACPGLAQGYFAHEAISDQRTLWHRLFINNTLRSFTDSTRRAQGING